MKKIFALLTLFTLFHSLYLRLPENSEITKIALEGEMDKKKYTIKSNEISEFINSDEKYIYFMELQNCYAINNETKETFKDIVPLSKFNSSIIIDPKDDSAKDIDIYITSILNNVDVAYLKRLNLHKNELLGKNLVIITYIDENQEQIIDLGSMENSLLFYYSKYDSQKINPKDIYPINKNKFTRYKGELLNLEKGSTYIIVAEIYKLDCIINVLDLFIAPQQIKQDIILENEDLLYLKQSENYYKIAFTDSYLNRILKLSKKTRDSEISLSNGEVILKGDKIYYELKEEEVKNGIQIKVGKKDCLIEILFSSESDTEVIDKNSIENHKLTKKYTIVKIPKKKCTYDISLTSKNPKHLSKLIYGYNYKISKNSYFYNPYLIEGKYSDEGVRIVLTSPYLYRTEIEEDEYEIFELVLDDEQLSNDIYLTYQPSGFYQILLKDIGENEARYIIGNITSILDKFYIYKDIAKKPPEIDNLPNYHHKPMDILANLRKISPANRTYLSLYQQIHNMLHSLRDLHLNIAMENIENKLLLSKAVLCLPFIFNIETVGDIPYLKTMINEDCLGLSPKKDLIREFLKKHEGIPLKSINGTNPFDYIQNFGNIQFIRSRHAQFTLNLQMVSASNMLNFPYDLSELLNIEYEFENGDIISLDYIIAQSQQINDVADKNEFEKFHMALVKNQSNPFLAPNIFQAKKLYQKSKGLLFEEPSNQIQWDIQTSDGQLKCRVDNDLKYNVFLQRSFTFQNTNEAVDVMIQCSEKFYSNNFKIVGIENFNTGGDPRLYEIWHQLIQQKTLDKTFRALIDNENVRQYFKRYKQYSGFSNIETCKFYGSIEDMGSITDNYGRSEIFEEEIKHKRTKIYDFLDKSMRKKLENIRKYNLEHNKQNLKNPTDIIIYTDSFCFSAGSGFIKAFQNTGGAIIVGFNGNPTIKGTNEFDGSQSSSSVGQFSCEESLNLENLGYVVNGITYSESFDDHYHETNPTPREYTVDLVDRRVPIYSQYFDGLYQLFLLKAGEIFEEFSHQCNKNNPKLVMDDENCPLDSHKKGGHPCGDNGQWDNSKCKAYYCELGYYYDQIKDECVLDICTNIPNEIEYYINDKTYMETKEIIVEPDSELVFHLENENYYYFFESNVENIISSYLGYTINNTNILICEKPKGLAFPYDVNVNYYKTLKQTAKIKVTTMEKNPNLYIMESRLEEIFIVGNYMGDINEHKYILSLHSPQEHVIYLSSLNNGINALYHEYNNDITPQEIINIESKKFTKFPNEINIMKKDKSYLFIFETPKDKYSLAYIFISPKYCEEIIYVSTNTKYSYLTKQEFDYKIVPTSNSRNLYIKLSSKTPDAEIEILDEKNSVINKDNKYYHVTKGTQYLSLRLKNNNDAFIEFLFEYSEVNSIDNNKKEFDLSKGQYLLQYNDINNIKSIQVSLESKSKISGIIYATIGKGKYISCIPPEAETNSVKLQTTYIIPEEKYESDESFIIFFNTNSDINVKVELEKKDGDGKSTDNSDKTENEDGFPIWAIILISIVGVAIIVIAIFLIVKSRKKKEDNGEENVENAGVLMAEMN